MTDTDDATPGAATGTGSRFGQGLVTGDDLPAVAAQAVDRALAPLDGAAPDLLVVFVSIGRTNRTDLAEQAGLAAMERAGARTAIGCTAHGVIADGRGVEHEPAVAVWAATLPGATITPVTPGARVANDRSVTVTGLPDEGSRYAAALVLADPYTYPAHELVAQMNMRFPGMPVLGGLASAAGTPGSNRLFLDGVAHPQGAVALLLSGEIDIRTVVSQGCRPIGPSMIVTRSAQNRVQEIAGTSAGAKLTEIVTALSPEEQQQALAGLHIGVALDEYAEEHERGDFLIRPVLGIERETDAVVVGEAVDVGRTVRFQVRDADGAAQDLTDLLARAGDPARGALLFSCNGRGAGMFGTADHDVRIVREHMTGPVAGFFAAGEIGPVAGQNHLHGFTASVLLFG